MTNTDLLSKFPNPPVVRDALLSSLAVTPWALDDAPSFCLSNCRVVDVVAGCIRTDVDTVVVEEGVITQLCRARDVKLALPIHDLGGRFVCPGLIDAHVHVTAVPGVQSMGDLLRLDEQVIALRTTHVLKGMLSRGFTSVRDTGGASKHIALAIEDGLIPGPRLFQCGKAISQTGGHGDLIPGKSGGDGSGCCGGHSLCYGRTADGVPGVLKAVREELKQGADFIKIMVGGGVSSEADGIDTVQYTAEEIRAITTTAWQMGKKMCTAHAYTPEAIRHAIDNGVRGIEHGNLLDRETAVMMAEKDIYLTPTLSCYGIMVRPPFQEFLSMNGRLKSVEVMAKGLDALRMADEAGVTICYGSDLLVSMHALQTEEFTVRAGVLSSLSILRSATVNPARMLGKQGKLGVIAPGAIADMLVLSANPLDDIRVLDRPELYLKAVYKEGRLVSGRIC